MFSAAALREAMNLELLKQRAEREESRSIILKNLELNQEGIKAEMVQNLLNRIYHFYVRLPKTKYVDIDIVESAINWFVEQGIPKDALRISATSYSLIYIDLNYCQQQ